MTRYASRRPRPKAADWDHPPDLYSYGYDETLEPALTVDIADAQPTGLLDKDGHPIYRLPNKIGF